MEVKAIRELRNCPLWDFNHRPTYRNRNMLDIDTSIITQFVCSTLNFIVIPLQFQARSDATGSPGSSSGNSSGSSNSEKSVRFSDRDLIMATPDLPPLPPDDFQQQRGAVPRNPAAARKSTGRACGGSDSPAGAAAKSFAKSILKAVDPSGDLDSNSDTGLSSLHSSSDEGTYVLDTLV